MRGVLTTLRQAEQVWIHHIFTRFSFFPHSAESLYPDFISAERERNGSDVYFSEGNRTLALRKILFAIRRVHDVHVKGKQSQLIKMHNLQGYLFQKFRAGGLHSS